MNIELYGTKNTMDAWMDGLMEGLMEGWMDLEYSILLLLHLDFHLTWCAAWMCVSDSGHRQTSNRAISGREN